MYVILRVFYMYRETIFQQIIVDFKVPIYLQIVVTLRELHDLAEAAFFQER